MKKAFTLVEMIIVMVVVMIIFAMMLPAMAPLMAKSGVDGSAWTLQAGLMQARAMAAKTGITHWVTFNSATPAGVYSRDNADAWWAIVRCDTAGCDGSVACNHAANWAGNNLAPTAVCENSMVGPLHRLNEGAAFLAVSWRDSNRVAWFKMNAGSPQYGAGGATAPQGWMGNYRIGFGATGQAQFVIAGNIVTNTNWTTYNSPTTHTGDAATDGRQFIVITKEGTVANRDYYMPLLGVTVDLLTGMPGCAKVRPPCPDHTAPPASHTWNAGRPATELWMSGDLGAPAEHLP